jgi:thiol-disulfide isomerase/thioredoxin
MSNKIVNNNKISLYNNIFGKEKGILELTLKDFIYKDNKLYINNSYFYQNKGLIIFYSPLCKHCSNLSETLINIALSYLNLFGIGSVNTENIKDKNDYLSLYAKITKVPTIKYINEEGLLIDYPHSYTNDNFLFYINMNI